jgi:protein phosphatase
MRFYTLSDKGKVRPNNEDYVEGMELSWSGPLGNPQALTSLILADGMGGAAAGEFASLLAVRTVRNKLLNGILNRPPEEILATDLKQFLADCCIEANQAIFHKSREEPELEGMGTTLVTIIVHKESMTIGHVGDSRAYMYRNGKLSQITRDHSLVQELVDEGKITAQQALTHPNRNIITRALGVDPVVKPECDRLPLLPDDVILLCSDGLHGFAEDCTIKKAFQDMVVENKVNFQGLAQRLIEVAYFGGGGDNISVALYHHQP